jgi:hypothetical protein
MHRADQSSTAEYPTTGGAIPLTPRLDHCSRVFRPAWTSIMRSMHRSDPKLDAPPHGT